jgi:hypothetical protein
MKLLCSKCGKFATHNCRSCENLKQLCPLHALNHITKYNNHELNQFMIELNSKKFLAIENFREKFLKGIKETKTNILIAFGDIKQHLKSILTKVLTDISDIEYTYDLIYKSSLENNSIMTQDYEILKNFSIKSDLKNISNAENIKEYISSSLVPIVTQWTEIRVKLNSTEIKKRYTEIEESSFTHNRKLTNPIELINKITTNFTDISSIHSIGSSGSFSSEFDRGTSFNTEAGSGVSENFGFFPNRYDIKMIDLNELLVSTINFNISIDPSIQSTACKLNSQEYFYSNRTSSFILNFSTGIAEKISAIDSSLTGRGCVYKTDVVYCFGGSVDKGKNVAICHKFDRKKAAWIKIADLPKASTHNSASLINNNIYIVGFNINSIVYYNDFSNTFTGTYKLPSETKLICENWILANEEKTLWEINDNKISKHRMENHWAGELLAVSCSFRHQNFIYFIQNGSKLMRLDTVNKKVERINFRNV